MDQMLNWLRRKATEPLGPGHWQKAEQETKPKPKATQEVKKMKKEQEKINDETKNFSIKWPKKLVFMRRTSEWWNAWVGLMASKWEPWPMLFVKMGNRKFPQEPLSVTRPHKLHPEWNIWRKALSKCKEMNLLTVFFSFVPLFRGSGETGPIAVEILSPKSFHNDFVCGTEPKHN